VHSHNGKYFGHKVPTNEIKFKQNVNVELAVVAPNCAPPVKLMPEFTCFTDWTLFDNAVTTAGVSTAANVGVLIIRSLRDPLNILYFPYDAGVDTYKSKHIEAS
jgi:hypothetical protein